MVKNLNYSTVVVPSDGAASLEPLGTKEKFWYSQDEREILFKQGRKKTGEDWAEVAVSRICDLINIPHAHYDFAEYEGRLGVISESIVPLNGRLILGNELLARITSGYEHEKGYKQVEYTISRTYSLLVRMQKGNATPPMEWNATNAEIKTVLGLFTGFLLLDALVANQDRHHENWGFIITDDKRIYLAPTYDHGSSLGRNESDTRREQLLTTKDTKRNIENYILRAKSAFRSAGKDSKQRLSTLDAFFYFAQRNPLATTEWLKRLENITESSLRAIFASMPRVSLTAANFAIKLILSNKERLLFFKG